jgi:DNA-binding IclR family transcriptional regulator
VSASDGSGVKSAERALTILELFSQRGRALTFTQVAEMLGYPRSSLHGLLHTMADRGWLRLDPATRRFTLGLRAWELGQAHGGAAELARRAAPVLERLQRDLDGTVCVAMLDGADSVCVARSGDHVDAGRRTAAHTSGAGRVLLADLARPDRDRALAGHSDPDALHRALDRVRADGFGDSDGGDGTCTLAVPVRDARGTVVAALGFAAPAQRLDGGGRDDALRALRQGAEQIGAEMEAQPAR